MVVEVGELAIKREAFMFDPLGRKLSERMDRVREWLTTKVEKGKGVLWGTIERALERKPPKVLRAFLKTIEEMNTDQIAEVLEEKGLRPEVAKDAAVLCEALVDKRDHPEAMEALRRLLDRAKEAKILPQGLVGKLEARVLHVSRSKAAQRLREREPGLVAPPGRGPRGKEPEEGREVEEKRMREKWKGAAAGLLLFLVSCCGVYRTGRALVESTWLMREGGAIITSPDFARVLAVRRNLRNRGERAKSRKVMRLWEDATPWMDELTDGTIPPEELKRKAEWFEGLPGYYKVGTGRGWTATLREEGYFEGGKVNARKLRRALLRSGYPENLVDKFLSVYREWTGVEGIGWLSKEESLRRMREQERVVRAKMRISPTPTKPPRRRKGRWRI